MTLQCICMGCFFNLGMCIQKCLLVNCHIKITLVLSSETKSVMLYPEKETNIVKFVKKTKETCISVLHVIANNYNTSSIRLHLLPDYIT